MYESEIGASLNLSRRGMARLRNVAGHGAVGEAEGDVTGSPITRGSRVMGLGWILVCLLACPKTALSPFAPHSTIQRGTCCPFPSLPRKIDVAKGENEIENDLSHTVVEGFRVS